MSPDQPAFAPARGAPRPEIRRDSAPVAYTAALAEMTARNADVAAGTAPELIWLLEHPPVYTAGTSAVASDVLDPRFEVVPAGRGGRHTYHGPGQRVAYVVLDLGARGRDVRRFVHALEGWVIATLGDFGVSAWRSAAGVGIWTRDIDGREAKIGAIGVRIRRWVTMHGLAVNLAPDLGHFGGIVPCGIADAGVTSLARIGRPVAVADWDAALLARLDGVLAAIATPCGTPDAASCAEPRAPSRGQSDATPGGEPGLASCGHAAPRLCADAPSPAAPAPGIPLPAPPAPADPRPGETP